MMKNGIIGKLTGQKLRAEKKQPWKIKRTLLLDACASAQKYYPDEFMCFLGGDRKKRIIAEIVFLPTYNTRDSASILESTIPFDETILGSLHSHPNSTNQPSTADKKLFRKYALNIILGYPFIPERIGFYDEEGERTPVEITGE